MGVFGPRTVFVVAVKGYPGTHEFLLQDDGKWLHVKETTEIGECPNCHCGTLATCTCSASAGRLDNPPMRVCGCTRVFKWRMVLRMVCTLGLAHSTCVVVHWCTDTRSITTATHTHT